MTDLSCIIFVPMTVGNLINITKQLSDLVYYLFRFISYDSYFMHIIIIFQNTL